LPPHYYEMLASERLVTHVEKGKPVRRFERLPGRRAESLDALTYATAARAACAVQLASREDDLRRAPDAPAPKPTPTIIESEWMRRQRVDRDPWGSGGGWR
jgi:phage terminase large subunit GpA-like protein